MLTNMSNIAKQAEDLPAFEKQEVENFVLYTVAFLLVTVVLLALIHLIHFQLKRSKNIMEIYNTDLSFFSNNHMAITRS